MNKIAITEPVLSLPALCAALTACIVGIQEADNDQEGQSNLTTQDTRKIAEYIELAVAVISPLRREAKKT